MTDSTNLPTHVIRLADIAGRAETTFDLMPAPGQRNAIADALGIRGIKKLRFHGALTPLGRRDWRLEATLGATVVQDCVVTLAPVTTRIDESVARTYVADLPAVTGSEIEMPQDDSVDPLPSAIDLIEVLIEALSLALPPFPRAEGAEIGEAVFTEKGKSPMRDEDTRAFSGLAALKKTLENKDKDSE